MSEWFMPSETVNLEAETRAVRPFLAEVMVSAGPRKSVQDYESNQGNAELCEDCAGTCWVDKHLVFWLCDGSSNSVMLPRLRPAAGEEGLYSPFGFSARVLAKDLGQAFVEQICHSGVERDAAGLNKQTFLTFHSVAACWHKRLCSYVRRVEERGLRDRLVSALPQTAEGICRVDWATTFTGGVCSPDVRTLLIANYGDAGALVFNPQLSVIAPQRNFVRFEAEIIQEDTLRVDVKLVTPQSEPFAEYDQVEGFAVVSDGIYRAGLEKMLQELRGRPYSSLSKLRTDLLTWTDLSGDDKSVLFCRFSEGSGR